MILRKTFIIKNWKNWDDEVNICVSAFYNRFSVYPNVLLANRVTFARIDIIADKNKLRGPSGAKPGKYEFAEIGLFRACNYELDFCIDKKLPDKQVSLIYDSDPNNDDGEPVPEEDTDDMVKERAVNCA